MWQNVRDVFRHILSVLSQIIYNIYNNFTSECYKKKISPITGLEWPRGFQEVKVPRFRDNGTGSC